MTPVSETYLPEVSVVQILYWSAPFTLKATR